MHNRSMSVDFWTVKLGAASSVRFLKRRYGLRESPIELAIHAAHLSVDVDEGVELVVVEGAKIGIRLVLALDRDQATHVAERDFAEACGGDEGRASCIRLDRVLHLYGRDAEHVREDLAPNVRPRAAPCEVDL